MESSGTEEQAKTPEQGRNMFQNRTYEIDSNKITVSWREFSPTNKESPQDEAVIFLPGWSAGNARTLDNLVQQMSEDSERKSFLITTRPEKVMQDSLYQEAQAIKKLIVEKGLKKIILAGHSEGGSKAVNLIDILQKENPEINIEGLILLDPVGLYEQGGLELAGKFALDSMIKTTGSLARHPSLAIKGLQASSDIIFNMAKEIAATKVVGYPNRLLNQIKEMARANTHYEDVKCPVVLIQGEQDPVSSHERVIPTEQEAEDPNKRLIPRRKILKETFFPNSPQVDMLVPRKIGHHGIPHFRSEQISRVTLGLLERYWRTQNKVPTQPFPINPSK